MTRKEASHRSIRREKKLGEKQRRITITSPEKLSASNNYKSNLYPISNNLHIEHYTSYFHTRNPSHLSFPQLNQVIYLHGYSKLYKENRRKQVFQQTVSEIGELETPHRTTLNDVVEGSPTLVSIKQVNADLDLLQWNNEGVVRSVDSLSFYSKPNNNNNDDDDGDGQMKKRRRRKRVSKEKEKRVVFDAIHLTKPRTKKCRIKRKCLSNIGVLEAVCGF